MWEYSLIWWIVNTKKPWITSSSKRAKKIYQKRGTGSWVITTQSECRLQSKVDCWSLVAKSLKNHSWSWSWPKKKTYDVRKTPSFTGQRKVKLQNLRTAWKTIWNWLTIYERALKETRQTSRVALDSAKKLEEKDNIEPETRPLRISLETTDDAEVMKKSWSKLKSAKHELRNLRISPHRSMKDRKCYMCCTKSKKLDCRGIRKLHTYSQRGENSGNKETGC